MQVVAPAPRPRGCQPPSVAGVVGRPRLRVSVAARAGPGRRPRREAHRARSLRLQHPPLRPRLRPRRGRARGVRRQQRRPSRRRRGRDRRRRRVHRRRRHPLRRRHLRDLRERHLDRDPAVPGVLRRLARLRRVHARRRLLRRRRRLQLRHRRHPGLAGHQLHRHPGLRRRRLHRPVRRRRRQPQLPRLRVLRGRPRQRDRGPGPGRLGSSCSPVRPAPAPSRPSRPGRRQASTTPPRACGATSPADVCPAGYTCQSTSACILDAQALAVRDRGVEPAEQAGVDVTITDAGGHDQDDDGRGRHGPVPLVPPAARASPTCRSTGTMQDKAGLLRLPPTLPIVAYQFNPLDNVGVFSNDASLLIPRATFDTKYSGRSATRP